MKRSLWLPMLAAVAAFLVALLIFGPLVYRPGYFVFEGFGDAYKNYYTFGYHLLHDTQFWRFKGMLYPYSEQVVFSDAQPMLSGFFQQIQHYVAPLGLRGAFGWHNFLLWIGLALGAYFLCRLLIHFGTPTWYAIIGGVGLACLSPQHFRLVGHFALAYVCFFPWYWYSLLKAQDRKLLPWGLAPALLLYFFGFVHIYYLGLGLFFGFGFYALQILVNRKDWKQLLLRLGVHVLLPFLLVRGTLWLTETVNDRPQSPWGHFAYNTNFYGLIYPFHSERLMAKWPPFWHRPPIEGMETEVYLGLATLAFLWVFLLLLNNRLIFGKGDKTSLLLPSLLIFSLASAFFVLLFSMGYPLKLVGTKAMTYLGPLRQFRATARFSWVFYYTAGVAALVFFHRLGQLRLIGRWKILMALPAVLVLVEGVLHLREVRKRINPYEYQRVPEVSLDYKKYQALLPCPIFLEGSEISGASTQANIHTKAFTLSLQTGLPILGSTMSRTSWKMTLKLLPLLYDVYKTPPFVADLPNKKPFLMLTPSSGDIRPMEKALIGHARKLADTNGFAYFELPYEALIKVHEEHRLKKLEEAHTLVAGGQALKASDFLHKSFDEFASDTPFAGRGAAQFLPRMDKPFFEGTLPASGGDAYTLDFWMYLAKEMQPAHQLRIRQYNEKGEEISYESKRLSEIVQALDGYWGLLEYTFGRKEPNARVKITIEPDQDNYFAEPGRILLDELTIRPVNGNVILSRPDEIWWNGRRYAEKVK